MHIVFLVFSYFVFVYCSYRGVMDRADRLLTGHKLSDRLVSGATEARDVYVGRGHRATVRQHSGDRSVSEAVSA